MGNFVRPNGGCGISAVERFDLGGNSLGRRVHVGVVSLASFILLLRR